MFTGIIEEIGTISHINNVSERAIQLTIDAKKVLEDVELGDSIAVNGICLTVTKYSANNFQVDVMPETIKATSLAKIVVGSTVNLERSMPTNGRFGGHFVSGHVDRTGEIIKKQKEENAIYYTIEIEAENSKFILDRGSIAVDGISLTIFNKSKNTFTISLIPHTVKQTTLGAKGVGDMVNIEYDMLGKYIYQMLADQRTESAGRLNESFLKSTGFM